MSVWNISWSEPQALNAIINIMIAPKMIPKFGAWWTLVHPSLLGMEKLDNDGDGDGEVMSQPSEDEDPIQVDNPIHDGLPQGGEVVGGLDVLMIMAPTPGKNWIFDSYF